MLSGSFLSAAPTSQIKNDIPLARQACQVAQGTIVGGFDQ